MEGRVRIRVSGFLPEGIIDIVVGDRMVFSIRPNLSNLVEEVLVEEELSDVLDTAAGDGVFRMNGDVRMRNDVDVVRAAAVMTWENSRQTRNTILIRLLNTAQRSAIHVTVVKEVSVSFVDDTGVHAGGVGVPQIPPHPCDRLAGDVVNKPSLDDNRDTGFVFPHVFPDELAADIVRAIITVRVQENVSGTRKHSMEVVRRNKRAIVQMAGIEDLVRVAFDLVTLLVLVDNSGTAGSGAGFDAFAFEDAGAGVSAAFRAVSIRVSRGRFRGRLARGWRLGLRGPLRRV